MSAQTVAEEATTRVRPVVLPDTDTDVAAIAPAYADPATRDMLFALLGGQPVYLPEVDLVALSNMPYDGLDPGQPPGEWTAAQVALDYYLLRVGDERRVGGPRARDLHYDLQRYVLPFLLVRRAHGTRPLPVTSLTVQDTRYFANVLAGERELPAAVLAAARLPERLALTCHWLTVADVAAIADCAEQQVHRLLDDGALPAHRDIHGRPLMRAEHLRAAGLLIADGSPHGLGADGADNLTALLRSSWQHAVDLGVPLLGNPRAVKAKEPTPANRKRQAKARKRVYVPITRCAEVARHLHPVHQAILWTQRTMGPRIGEVFGPRVAVWQDGWLHLTGIGGARRDVRGEDGRFSAADSRRGTKGSREGLVIADPEDDPAHGLLERRVPAPALTQMLLDSIVTVFHTDPVTGAVDSEARLIPGLQDDDRGGLSAYETALRRACELSATDSAGGPCEFTSHDLRASLQTDLDNAGVPERVSRYMLGHRSKNGQALDVHERHYDLGPDAPLLEDAAARIEVLLRQTVLDLRIPTALRAQFGRTTRAAQRRDYIDRQLRLGWYRPARPATRPSLTGTAATADEEYLSVRETAAVLDLRESQVKRMLTSGALSGQQVPWEQRRVWAVPRSAVERELARRNQPTLATLSAELGMPYHSLWYLVQALGLVADRIAGKALYLTDDQANAIRAEVRRLTTAADGVLPTTAAASRLQLPHPFVQILVRRGYLSEAPSGVNTRLMHVTVDSVEAYEGRYPTPSVVEPGERIVPITKVGAVLGLSRHGVTHLVCTRKLAIVSIYRRQHVGVRSLRRWLDQHPGQGKPGLVAMHSVAQATTFADSRRVSGAPDTTVRSA